MTRLVLFLSLIGAVTADGACSAGNPPFCPPPFPDFTTLFRQTLDSIPELALLLKNATLTDSQDCPMAVNWTSFNTQLDAGNLIPLDPVCYPLTTPPNHYSSTPVSFRPSTSILTPAVHPSSNQPPPDVDSSPTAELSTIEIPPDAKPQQTGPNDGKTIGLAVGIAAGVLLVATVVIIIVVSVRCRQRQQIDVLKRGVSTNSEARLVTEESFQPTTPGTSFPPDPMGGFENSSYSWEASEGVIKIRDTTILESSTDATLPRKMDRGHENLEEIVVALKEMDSLEKIKTGYKNAAVEAEDEQYDPGYAGSEVGQEIWENEMNMLFDRAIMESSEDVNVVDQLPQKDRQVENGSGSVRYAEPPQFVVPTVNDRSRDLFRLPSAKHLSSLKINLPPPSTPSSSQLSETPSGSSFSTPSSTKPLVSPRGSKSRHPLSQAIDPGRSSVKTKGVRFALDSTEAPPAYSSPVSTLTEISDYFDDDQREAHVEIPIDVPNDLPIYSEALVSLEEHDSHPTESQPKTSSITKQRQPTPKPRPSIDSQTSPASSHQGRGTSTAVIRPWVPPTGASTAGVITAHESRGVDSISTDSDKERSPALEYSSRPVRSLLSQFEASSRKDTNSDNNPRKT